jgi:hypothetical protein
VVKHELSIDGVPTKPITEEFLHYDGSFTYEGPDKFLFERGRLLRMDIGEAEEVYMRVVKVEVTPHGGITIYFVHAAQL